MNMDKKEANILLLSDKEREYQTLVNAGYKNVFWFKSSLRAYEYFKTREDELKKFDIILRGSRTIEYFNSAKYNQPFTNVTFNSCDVEKLSFFTGQCVGDERMLFFMSHPNVTSLGVPVDEFLSTLNDVIPNELKGEVIEIPEVEVKEVVLPENREDVKVLFIGYEKNNEVVESVFKDSGLTNYQFIQSANFSLEDSVERLADYDLVVADNMYNAKLCLMGDEFQDYMKDKGKSIYFIFYHSFYKGEGINKFYLNGFSTENPSDKKRPNFKSMESEEDSLKDLMGLAINSYCSYNNNMGDGGYPDKDALDQKCDEKYVVACAKAKLATERIYELATIQRYLFDYREFLSKGPYNLAFTGLRLDVIKNGVRISFKGLSIDILEDAVSIAFLVGTREGARLTFKDEDRKPGELCDQFYLEYLSGKGKPHPPVIRRYYNHYDPSLKIENLASDEEMRKVSAIYNRMCEVLSPIVDELKEKERQQEENSQKNDNKKYSKTYSESDSKK